MSDAQRAKAWVARHAPTIVTPDYTYPEYILDGLKRLHAVPFGKNKDSYGFPDGSLLKLRVYKAWDGYAGVYQTRTAQSAFSCA